MIPSASIRHRHWGTGSFTILPFSPSLPPSLPPSFPPSLPSDRPTRRHDVMHRSTISIRYRMRPDGRRTSGIIITHSDVTLGTRRRMRERTRANVPRTDHARGMVVVAARQEKDDRKTERRDGAAGWLADDCNSGSKFVVIKRAIDAVCSSHHRIVAPEGRRAGWKRGC